MNKWTMNENRRILVSLKAQPPRCRGDSAPKMRLTAVAPEPRQLLWRFHEEGRGPVNSSVRRHRIATYLFMVNNQFKTITLLLAILIFCQTASTEKHRPIELQNIGNTLG